MAPQIRNRQIPGDQSRDPAIVELLTYSEKSGARKSVNMGLALLPLQNGAASWTTNATTPVSLPAAGQQLAIFNNSAAVQAVTVGDSTMTAQAAGAVQAGPNPFVGVACQPNTWTYLSTAQWSYVAATSANLLVYLVDDPTYMFPQPATNASANQIQLGTPGVANTAPSGAPVNEPNT
jgi:hypothetical protein